MPPRSALFKAVFLKLSTGNSRIRSANSILCTRQRQEVQLAISLGKITRHTSSSRTIRFTSSPSSNLCLAFSSTANTEGKTDLKGRNPFETLYVEKEGRKCSCLKCIPLMTGLLEMGGGGGAPAYPRTEVLTQLMQ